MGGINNTGVWTPQTTTATQYLADIDNMNNNLWIDAQTSNVITSCGIINPGKSIILYLFYSVEFLPSGRVLPSHPFITIDYWDVWDDWQGFLPLFIGMIFFANEVQDMVVDGRAYLVEQGWLNLIDWLAILACFWMFVTSMIWLAVKPSFNTQHMDYWDVATSQSHFQQAAAFCIFLIVFKGVSSSAPSALSPRSAVSPQILNS